MMGCWEMEPDKQSSFSTLVHTLTKSLENMAGYLHIGAFPDLNEENAHQAQIGATAETVHASTGQVEPQHLRKENY